MVIRVRILEDFAADERIDDQDCRCEFELLQGDSIEIRTLPNFFDGIPDYREEQIHPDFRRLTFQVFDIYGGENRGALIDATEVKLCIDPV